MFLKLGVMFEIDNEWRSILHKNKSVILISYVFGPLNSTGAIRWTKLVKYLDRKGYRIFVISSTYSRRPVDATLKRDLLNLKNTKVYYVYSSEKLVEMIGRIFRILRSKFFVSLHRNVSKNDDFLLDIKDVVRTTIKKKVWMFLSSIRLIQILKKNEIDFVISTSPPIHNHKLARFVKLKYGMKWVADFRDPYLWNRYGQEASYRKSINIENDILNDSNIVTAVSKGILDDFMNRARVINNTRVKTIFKNIYNGFDIEDLDFVLNRKTNVNDFVITYVGGLAEGRDITMLFDVIQDILKLERININVKLNYYGNQFEVLLKFAEKFKNIKDLLINYGHTSRVNSLIAQQNSDLMILLTWNTDYNKGVITGKFFEYLLNKKNIICLVTGLPRSEIRKIIEKINCGFVGEYAYYNKDRERLKRYIMGKIGEKQKYGRVLTNYNDKELYKYNYQNLAGMVDILLNRQK